MDKDRIFSVLTAVICTVGSIVITVASVIVYRKYLPVKDVLTYTVIVLVILGFYIVKVIEVMEVIAYDLEVHASPKVTAHERSLADDDLQPADEDDDPREFRRPAGFIPDPYDPEHRFRDIYGHQYIKISGTWYDEYGNIAPDYMCDYYGITHYEERQKEQRGS